MLIFPMFNTCWATLQVQVEQLVALHVGYVKINIVNELEAATR